eukprot:TRINITY_DN4927_c0_g1_i3.p1 TRINITY_DN4927_c0_g1~~TRINITY_DN4927_c0_g1_i3.p1  ORF type:complete len:407 (+),score=38.58 TRINITY_DN4927_c0_g1_i3:73-1293(+)
MLIFALLPAQDIIARASRVSKQWNAAGNDEFLWIMLCERDFGFLCSSDELSSAKSQFKLLFLNNYEVYARVRPLSMREMAMNCSNIVEIDATHRCLSLKSAPGFEIHGRSSFNMTKCFDTTCTQSDISEAVVQPMVRQALFNGRHGCVIAYGQTGAGKTFTMFGADVTPELEGVIPRTLDTIFSLMSTHPQQQCSVQMGVLECYMEKLHDLTNDDDRSHSIKMMLRESASGIISVENMRWTSIASPSEGRELVRKSLLNRAVAATQMGSVSSRSHCIVLIRLLKGDKFTELALVDLAGSERALKFGATGLVLKEVASINKSLSTLANIVNALYKAERRHVPYRDSVLTRLLQMHLAARRGSCRVLCAMSPSSMSVDETRCTLLFGERLGSIPAALARALSDKRPKA